ncbi:hypothetical protein M404DRAFT_31965 [Pisolithus tinctorius Marx 270]|uniref:Uncharacterized protein n=1 Tax=Pisolithus tinctorius Marx 270 TaxID=870435 RepID=A0A0C3NQC0_PISTI|nr:hypothetical protein M404DRAFT_31965 [Pisolithus tinctorius Marx 270]
MSNGGRLEGASTLTSHQSMLVESDGGNQNSVLCHGTVTESLVNLLFLSPITSPMKRLRPYCKSYTPSNAGSRSPKGEHSVLALGTGDVSTFTAGIPLVSGANVIATSSPDEKLEVAPNWDGEVSKIKIKASCFADWRTRVDYVIEVGGPNVLQKS